MTFDLDDLFEACGSNAGGLCKLQFILVSDVVRIPDVVKQIVSAPVELKLNSRFYEIVFEMSNGSFKEPQADNDNGEFFKPAIQVFAAKDTPDASNVASLLKGQRFVAIYQDGNGYSKLVGTPDYPLSFKSELETGNNNAGKNGHTFTFSGEVPFKAPFYLTEVVEEVPGPGSPVTIVKSNGEVIATLVPGAVFEINSGFSFGFRILS